MNIQSNQTNVKYFILIGISDDPKLQFPIFLLVLVIYLITLSANMTILIACRDPLLHTPMYFFLANLSIIDFCGSTISLHRILINFLSCDKVISFHACMAQMYMFSSFGCLSLLIVTAMSFDRYVAICKPLCYHMIMNTRTCAILAASCWMLAFLEILPPFCLVYNLSCYFSIKINHFLCDIGSLMAMSCNDTSVVEMVFFIEGLFPVILAPFVLTLVPYIFIIVAILGIRSGTGRRKTFYTCSSHLTIVILLYMTLFGQYLTPYPSSTLESKKLFALFYIAAVPMLNPIIYSLKNKDLKTALKRTLKRSNKLKNIESFLL